MDSIENPLGARLNLETLMEEKLRSLGYTRKWIESGILTEEVLESQVKDVSGDGGVSNEHFRFSVLCNWLNEQIRASDSEIQYFLEVAVEDPDESMAGSSVEKLLHCSWLTDSQYLRVSNQLKGYGTWTLKSIERASLKRKLSHSSISDEFFDELIDNGSYKTAFEHPGITREQMETISIKAPSRKLRNLARQECFNKKRWKS